jgi:hypothetical protein
MLHAITEQARDLRRTREIYYILQHKQDSQANRDAGVTDILR